MTPTPIGENVKRILSELPPGVELEAACKTRSADEIQQAVDAGISVLGENYIQEAESVFPDIRSGVRWHLIGHLQKNKATKAVKLFDMVESLDSLALAEVIDRKSFAIGRVTECLVEINSAVEKNKHGVYPEDAENFLRRAASLRNIRIRGLMTMGPLTEDSEEVRPYFRKTRLLFKKFREMEIPGINMNILSMGMSSSYRVAIQEGATLIRVGTAVFGPR